MEISSLSESKRKKYQASFIGGVSDEQKKKFAESRLMFLISVGAHYHEGAKLEAALKYINKFFKEFVFVVADSLQRYTHAIVSGSTPSQMLGVSKDEGEIWLENNEHIIKRSITKPYKITRWCKYLDQQESKKKFDVMPILSTKEYQRASELDKSEFLNRIAKKNDLRISPATADLCIQYLNEESTVFITLAEENCEFITYPYGLNNVMKYTFEAFIKKHYEERLQEVPYRMKGKYSKC